MISKRALMVDASGIRKVFELAAKIENPVNLSIGQPDFDVPQNIKDKAISAIQSGFNRYTLTQGISELRAKVVGFIKESRDVNVDENDVLITSGGSGGLQLALMSILDPDDEVIFFDPYFVMYKHLTNLIGGRPVAVDTYPDFKIDEKNLEKAVSKRTKAIILNSPSNPTGVVYSKEDVDAVIAVADKHGLLVISDEIYDSFVYDGEYASPLGHYENVLLLGSFSKTYGMTGWRMGYAAGPSEVIEQMKKIQQYTFVCAPAPFQYATLEAMDTPMDEVRKNYGKKRDRVYEGLKDRFNLVKPGGAFYAFPKVKKGTGSAFVEKAIERELLIIPGNVFSERNENFRISFAASDETIEKGVEIMNRLADELWG